MSCLSHLNFLKSRVNLPQNWLGTIQTTERNTCQKQSRIHHYKKMAGCRICRDRLQKTNFISSKIHRRLTFFDNKTSDDEVFSGLLINILHADIFIFRVLLQLSDGTFLLIKIPMLILEVQYLSIIGKCKLIECKLKPYFKFRLIQFQSIMR